MTDDEPRSWRDGRQPGINGRRLYTRFETKHPPRQPPPPSRRAPLVLGESKRVDTTPAEAVPAPRTRRLRRMLRRTVRGFWWFVDAFVKATIGFILGAVFILFIGWLAYEFFFGR